PGAHVDRVVLLTKSASWNTAADPGGSVCGDVFVTTARRCTSVDRAGAATWSSWAARSSTSTVARDVVPSAGPATTRAGRYVAATGPSSTFACATSIGANPSSSSSCSIARRAGCGIAAAGAGAPGAPPYAANACIGGGGGSSRSRYQGRSSGIATTPDG